MKHICTLATTQCEPVEKRQLAVFSLSVLLIFLLLYLTPQTKFKCLPKQTSSKCLISAATFRFLKSSRCRWNRKTAYGDGCYFGQPCSHTLGANCVTASSSYNSNFRFTVGCRNFTAKIISIIICTFIGNCCAFRYNSSMHFDAFTCFFHSRFLRHELKYLRARHSVAA